MDDILNEIAYIQTIPLEIKAEIFYFFPLKTLLILQRVCKQWFDEIRNLDGHPERRQWVYDLQTKYWDIMISHLKTTFGILKKKQPIISTIHLNQLQIDCKEKKYFAMWSLYNFFVIGVAEKIVVFRVKPTMEFEILDSISCFLNGKTTSIGLGALFSNQIQKKIFKFFERNCVYFLSFCDRIYRKTIIELTPSLDYITFEPYIKNPTAWYFIATLNTNKKGESGNGNKTTFRIYVFHEERLKENSFKISSCSYVDCEITYGHEIACLMDGNFFWIFVTDTKLCKFEISQGNLICLETHEKPHLLKYSKKLMYIGDEICSVFRRYQEGVNDFSEIVFESNDELYPLRIEDGISDPTFEYFKGNLMLKYVSFSQFIPLKSVKSISLVDVEKIPKKEALVLSYLDRNIFQKSESPVGKHYSLCGEQLSEFIPILHLELIADQEKRKEKSYAELKQKVSNFFSFEPSFTLPESLNFTDDVFDELPITTSIEMVIPFNSVFKEKEQENEPPIYRDCIENIGFFDHGIAYSIKSSNDIYFLFYD